MACRGGAPVSETGRAPTDTSPTVDAVRHAVEWLERHGQRLDIVVTLQPTSPLRGSTEIDDVLALLDDPEIRSAATVTPLDVASSVLGTVHDGRFRRLANASGDDRRQASTGIVRLTGSVYATRRDLLDENRLLDDAPAVLVTHGAAAIDIDDRAGLLAARRELRSGR